MRQLQEIARDGNRTVVATVYQPSSEVFVLFDKLYLMSDRAVFYVSPADYFMRQLVVVYKASDTAEVVRVEVLRTAWATQQHTSMLLRPRTMQEDLKIDKFKKDKLGIVGQLRMVLCVMGFTGRRSESKQARDATA
ncbi:putative ABC transporter domain-containing protein [Phytophthora infestans]|uniref:Putative ABC transporter domain-containing protein n=1 Tax=Phytophthora infestans TaxID=4787 RepID=A0A833RZ94_PHYIN|nr:putative ABC transporter domain-containing protein [Phytophthora infestans]